MTRDGTVGRSDATEGSLTLRWDVSRLPLQQIFTLFGTDKQREGGHSYATAYADVLGRLRSKRIKMLEIGLLKGSSLLGWRAYFPHASIAGFDIMPKPEMARSGVRVYQGDQGSAADLDRVCAAEAPFDLIIDDGSHFNRHQLFSFHPLFPHLKDGGIYVIEDVQTHTGTVQSATSNGMALIHLRQTLKILASVNFWS